LFGVNVWDTLLSVQFVFMTRFFVFCFW